MLKAYKFRLYPDKEQKIYFTKCFGCVWFIYSLGKLVSLEILARKPAKL